MFGARNHCVHVGKSRHRWRNRFDEIGNNDGALGQLIAHDVPGMLAGGHREGTSQTSGGWMTGRNNRGVARCERGAAANLADEHVVMIPIGK